MSAFICTPEHHAALAAFACTPRHGHRSHLREWEKASHEETCKEVARQLAWHNIRSVAHRYPDDKDGERPGPSGMTDAEMMDKAAEIAAHYLYSPPELSPVDILKMSQCYDYQTCETEDYANTLAARQIEWIKSAAMNMLPGYGDAKWEFRDENPFESSRPVSLMKFVKKSARK